MKTDVNHCVSVFCSIFVLFRTLIKKLNSRYELPSRKYFMDVEIPKLYQSTRANMQQDLASFEYYSATTDIWTSRNMMSYMSVTVQVSPYII